MHPRSFSRARVLRRSGRALLVILLVAIGLLATAAPAGAHAVVVSSSPANDAHLASAPSEVTVEFSEAVSAELGGLKVLDSSGARVDNGSSDQPQPTALHTTVRSGLADGTYLINYKVVSADGHPVAGVIVFTFGNVGATDVSNLVEKTNPWLDAGSKAAQFLTYLGALLAVGVALFAAFLHDGGADGRRLVTLVRVATLLGVLGIVATIDVQAALVTSGSLRAAFDPAILRPVLAQGLGWQSGVLLLGLGLVHASVDVGHRTVRQSLAFYGGLTATSSFVLWGHATESTSRWLTIPADVVHVAVAAAWFGGLVGLGLVLRSRAAAGIHDERATPALDDAEVMADDEPTAGAEPATLAPGSLASTVRIVQRFSAMAAGSVILLTIAGVALAWVPVGSIDGLTTTTYGTLVLVKVAVVAVILFIAAYNRYFLLPWLFAEAPDDGATNAERAAVLVGVGVGAEVVEGGGTAEHGRVVDAPAGTDTDDPDAADDLRAGWRTLRTTLRLEALAVVAVLAITAVLVNTTPASTAAKPVAGPFQDTKPFRTGKVSLTITPNLAGKNSFHLDLLGADGRPADLAQKMTIEARLPAKDLGPLQRDMVKAGTGHFLVEDIPDLSIAGEWEITLVARVSDFDQERITFDDTVG